MKPIQIEKYKCEICGELYGTIDAAKRCESKPVLQDKGVKVGDRIKVTSGEGAGTMATVDSRFIYNMEWGHYAADKYWHTVGLTAKLDSWGSRQLTFDSYEPSPVSVPSESTTVQP